jgi:hypothetical protein
LPASPDSWSSPTTSPPTWTLTPNLPPWRLMAYPSTYPASRCSPLDTQIALGRLAGATSTSPHNPTRHCVSWSPTATLPLSSSANARGGLPCKGTSCLRRSFDESKRCTQHPELANLLVELKRTRRWFIHEYGILVPRPSGLAVHPWHPQPDVPQG